MGKSLILDSSGTPMPRASAVKMTPSPPPYGAADRYSQELSSWNPVLGSPDSDFLPDRNTIVARTRDLVRNQGWASSALTRLLDNVIGTGFLCKPKPDYKALGLSQEWAMEFSEKTESLWRIYSEDSDFWCDAARRDNFNGLMRVAYRHYAVDGDAIGLARWIKEKPGQRQKTTIQIIHPDRLSNPSDRMDAYNIRGGVELNEYGAAVAYHIRKSHPAEMMYAGANVFEWERIARETSWGRQICIHAFDSAEAGRTRGISRFAPVIERFKMVDRYDRIELQAALINAIFSAYIVSPMDHELLMDSIEDGQLSRYQADRKEFHSEKKLTLGGVVVPTLYPGEDIKLQTATRPNVAFGDFERACLRNIASAMGLSYEQLSQDWSQVNYSSARAAMLEVWKTLSSDRATFTNKFATPFYHLWLEEVIETGLLELPKEAPPFAIGKNAYGRVKWIGSGRGYVDPEKEAKAEERRLSNGTSTLEDECAAQGKDWKDVLQQQSIERRERERLGLPLPGWIAPEQEPKDDAENE